MEELSMILFFSACILVVFIIIYSILASSGNDLKNISFEEDEVEYIQEEGDD